MGDRFVVLGAGLIGASLVASLRQQFPLSEINVLSRSAPRHLMSYDVDVTLGEIGDGALRGYFRDGDTVFMAHGVASPRCSTRDARQVSLPILHSATEVVEELSDVRSGRVVVFSSGGAVYGPSSQPVDENCPSAPSTIYGATKLAEEVLIGQLEHTNDPTTVLVLRCSTVYGLRAPGIYAQGLVQTILEHVNAKTPVPIFGRGLSRRGYIHSMDVANIAIHLILAEDRQSKVYNVCSGDIRSINDVINAVARVVDRRVDTVHTPAEDFDIVLSSSLLRNEFPSISACRLEQGIERMLSQA